MTKNCFSIVLSYSSAASSTSNKRPAPAKARVAPSAKPVQNNLDSSVDESSLRLGGKLLINLILEFNSKNKMYDYRAVTWSQQITYLNHDVISVTPVTEQC